MRRLLRIGLVQELVEPGRQLDRAIELATTVGAQAPLGVQATIASARGALLEETAARALMPEIVRLMSTEDAREGLRSFLERRSARFAGREGSPGPGRHSRSISRTLAPSSTI